MKYKLAILTTTINPDVIELMHTSAKDEIGMQSAQLVRTEKTLGCLDMPVIADVLFQQEDVDGLVVLGAVAQGETKHDELVVNVMTDKVIELSIKYKKPVGFGVIGPGAKPDQFLPRAEEYARRAVQACIQNLDIINK
ncbi:MAG: 6,7-dimethyl-8-ribityllumazine synthase [bacterium]|nr:6,7-dimethyl-8-ribityllumazine synthase [bacterium]